jgi:PBP1b-binding outer membrane lipoprotein LpoB
MIKFKHVVYSLLGTALFYTGCSNKSEQAVAPNIANETITQASLKFVNATNAADTTSCTYTFHVDNTGKVTSVDSTA